jgi:acetyl-CoA synthetase
MGEQVEAPLESILEEERVFPPPPQFREQANVRDPQVYQEAERDPEGFWARWARELTWFQPWEKVLEWDPPWAKWFVGGKTNLAYNCLDRHVAGPRRNKAAIIWEGEPGEVRVLTYWELYRQVCRFANALKALGVRRGDRVTIYMPLVPEAAVAMLACARIGAIHSVVFAGFTADALRDRIQDAQAKVLVTAEGLWRRGNILPLKEYADQALEACPTVEKVVVFHRGCKEKEQVPMRSGRDIWWDEAMASAPLHCPPEEMDAEDMLYILYTSGTTGKPKGVVHTTGGYMVGIYATTQWVFDIKEGDTYWCTADIGWVTGHSYVVYGPLLCGATTLMYEGAPDWPQRDRWWSIIERHGVTILYTAPTAIRTFMRWGEEWPGRHDLSSLRLLGTVGEPINPEAWMWYWRYIGGGRCPVVDTWWQTETGMIMITPLPGITHCKPGSATLPFPGVRAEVVDDRGQPVPPGAGGYLVLTRPWPAMLRVLYGDPQRYVEQYWSRFPGIYFTGDGARRDQDGYFWIVGRIDDVVNVSGHRIGTMEVESILVEHPAVAEAAVVGRSHEVKGQALWAFVTPRDGVVAGPSLEEELREHVSKRIGAFARPDRVIFTPELPKTRSGKIMRRLLRDIAEGRALGDVTTLQDPEVVRSLKERYEHMEGG